MRLGLTLPLMSMETVPSFVSHIAQRNGLRHVQDFVQDMDLSWRKILQLDPDTIQHLAYLTGAGPEALAAGSFAPVGDGFFRFSGRDLPLSFLDRSVLKYCPVCVTNDRDVHGRTWGRALWQLNSLQVCPAHSLMLDALAPPDYPRCPHDFAGRIADHRALIDAFPVVEVSENAARFARYLTDRLHGHGDHCCDSWLDGFPLDVAARLCENVGTLVEAGPNQHPKALDRKSMIDVGASGFAICVKGPDALRDVYDSIRRRSPSSKGGFYADFGFIPDGCSAWLNRSDIGRCSIISKASYWIAIPWLRVRRSWGAAAPGGDGSPGEKSGGNMVSAPGASRGSSAPLALAVMICDG